MFDNFAFNMNIMDQHKLKPTEHVDKPKRLTELRLKIC